MAVRNYTTQISIEKTVMEIESILIKFGAQGIYKEYKGSVLYGIMFYLLKDGKKIPFKIPMPMEKTRTIVMKAVNEGKLPKKYLSEPLRTEQGGRVAWRIIKDWIDSQLSLLEMEFAEATEILLPYAFNVVENKTMYQLFNEISSNIFISTVSFFTDTTYNVTPTVYPVNISDLGFSSCNLTLMQNDSISWFNGRLINTEVKSLSSGWSNILLTPSLSQSVTYPIVGSWIFYVDGLQACQLTVVPYDNVVLAHDSGLDVVISFSLTTTVNPSSLVLTALQNNFSSFNNQSQSGVLEVKNSGNFPLYNVMLNDSMGWMSFSDNNFTMDAQSNRLLTFNLTPLILFTNQSNMTHIITIFGRSSNGGNKQSDISLFIPFTNLDNLNNGNVYNVNFLSINATLQACYDNRIGIGQYKPGFEECVKVEVAVNQTIIKEIPAVSTLPEATVIAIGDSASKTDALVQNNINSQGITQDYLMNISRQYDSTVIYMQGVYTVLSQWMDFTDMQVRKNIRDRRIFWITLISLIILILTLISLFLTWKYNWAVKTFQYNV